MLLWLDLGIVMSFLAFLLHVWHGGLLDLAQFDCWGIHLKPPICGSLEILEIRVILELNP